MTSSSSQSSSRSRLPASLLACIAAPSATTSSGLRLVSGGWPKNSATARRICGMRVAPPTSTTPLMSAGVRRASRSARRTGCSVFATNVCVIDVNTSSVRSRSTLEPSDNSAARRAASCPVSFSFTSRASTRRRRTSVGDGGGKRACSRAQQKIR